MGKPPRKPRPRRATPEQMEAARKAVQQIRAALANPALAGEKTNVHVYYGGCQGEWVTIYPGIPGLIGHRRYGARQFTHTLLPGWAYTPKEFKTEMIEDLERLATTGEFPTEATR